MARATYRKVITSPEAIENINIKNKKLVEKFLRNFNTKRQDAQVKVYRSNFNIFFCWNLQNNDNKFFIDIKKSQFMDFFDYAVEELKWSPNRYAQMWSSLNSLSNFIENILDDDYPDYKNQVKKIEKLPKAPVRKKTILSDTQIKNLLHYLSEEKNKPQEALLLALGAYSGQRISELFRFKVTDIDENNTAYDDLFLETTEEIKTKGRGKQGKLLYKYIIKEPFIPYFNAWLPIREMIMKENNQEHDFLFIKTDGSPAKADDGQRWMTRWEYYLTNEDPSNPEHIPVHMYAHCLRHYLCSFLSRVGLEQELIVELFGWSQGDMFQIYNDNSAKDRKWKGISKLKQVDFGE